MAEIKLGNKPFIVMLILSLIIGAIDMMFLVETPAWYYLILFTIKYFIVVVVMVLYILSQNEQPCGVEEL